MQTPGSIASPRWALLASVAGAVGASLCCAVPLLLVSLGVGGTWLASLTALEPYRPAFVGLAIGALGTAGWRLYGPASRCEDGRVCADRKILRRRRLLLWVVVAAVLPLLLFPYYVSWFA
jgi:mercuric ion transport protein